MIDVEQAESDFVFGIGLREEVFEGAPVPDRHLASSSSVCDVEQNAILLPLDFVLR